MTGAILLRELQGASFARRTAEGGCPHNTLSVRGRRGGGSFVLGVRSRGFQASRVQIGVHGIEDHHRQFGPEAVQFFFGPVAVQPGGAGDVLRKGLAIISFADQDVPY